MQTTDFRMWADRLASEHTTLASGHDDVALLSTCVYYEDIQVQALVLNRSDLSLSPATWCHWEFAE